MADRIHGNEAGYRQHMRRGEPVCDACRNGLTIARRLRWAANGEGVQRVKVRRAAHNRASTRLIALHRDEFNRLYREELYG